MKGMLDTIGTDFFISLNSFEKDGGSVGKVRLCTLNKCFGRGRAFGVEFDAELFLKARLSRIWR
jgi:hypothetical protein